MAARKMAQGLQDPDAAAIEGRPGAPRRDQEDVHRDVAAGTPDRRRVVMWPPRGRGLPAMAVAERRLRSVPLTPGTAERGARAEPPVR